MESDNDVKTYTQEEFDKACQDAYDLGHDEGYEHGYDIGYEEART